MVRVTGMDNRAEQHVLVIEIGVAAVKKSSTSNTANNNNNNHNDDGWTTV